MTIYTGLVIATGCYMLLFTLANIIYLLIVGRKTDLTDGPMVSVLIPARNEEGRIGPAIESLRMQDYGNYEVIVLDDNSEDHTMEVVISAIGEDRRFRYLRGEKLPDGWKGKPFAMEQLVHQARGEILLFLDADMRCETGLLSWTVTNLLHHRVDFLSGYARHLSPEPVEYLLFPVMYLATSFLLPLWLFRHTRSYMFSHAIGQFFCVRSDVIRAAGGFVPVKNRINEDIQLARHLKLMGYRQVFLDAKKYLSGNMYDSIGHARMGIMRVVYEYFDNKVYPFIVMGTVMFLFLILPLPLAAVAVVSGSPHARTLLIGILLVLTAWTATMADRKMPWYTGLLYPVHFGWTIVLAVHSIILARRGSGYQWKGRTVH